MDDGRAGAGHHAQAPGSLVVGADCPEAAGVGLERNLIRIGDYSVLYVVGVEEQPHRAGWYPAGIRIARSMAVIVRSDVDVRSAYLLDIGDMPGPLVR